MALSNIFKEPRRELTESAVGIGASLLVLVPYGLATYALAVNDPKPVKNFTFELLACGLVLLIVLVVSILIVAAFLATTHALGDATCNSLEKRGIQLRPKQRCR